MTVIHKIFHFLFGKPDESAIMNMTEQNIHKLKENQMMEQEQTKE